LEISENFEQISGAGKTTQILFEMHWQKRHVKEVMRKHNG
jgi:hypothetical protein